MASTRSIDGEAIRDLMLETLEYRFKKELPKHKIQWLSDNGPTYVTYETIAFGQQLGLDTCNTPAYRPEINGMAKAFVKTIKRDYV